LPKAFDGHLAVPDDPQVESANALLLHYLGNLLGCAQQRAQGAPSAADAAVLYDQGQDVN
jgi:hypothetical protein